MLIHIIFYKFQKREWYASSHVAPPSPSRPTNTPIFTRINKDVIFDLLFTILCPIREYFTHIMTSLLPVGNINIGHCSALMIFEQRGIFIVSYILLWHRTSVYTVSSERPPHAKSKGHCIPTLIRILGNNMKLCLREH